RDRARRTHGRHASVAAGAAGDPVGLEEAMIVAGIGCRKGTSAGDIGAVIGAALARAGFATKALDLIAAPGLKRGEQGIAPAAAPPPLLRSVAAICSGDALSVSMPVRSSRLTCCDIVRPGLDWSTPRR